MESIIMPSISGATTVEVPEGLAAEAFVIKGERASLWEKTLVVAFPERRKILSTSDGLMYVLAAINHSAQPQLWEKVSNRFMGEDGRGGKAYTDFIRNMIAGRLGVGPDDITRMATAADMDNLVVITREYKPLTVTVLVTAGAKENALRTGLDEGTYIEGEEPHGTINILLLTNARLTVGAMARAIVTVTEAKTAAMEELKIPSSYTKDAQATGTGTDNVMVVSGTTGPVATYCGGHSRLGELMGKAAYRAVLEALGKQNGFVK